MNVYQEQLSLGFDDLLNAANEEALDLKTTFSIGKVKRDLPKGIAALSSAEVKEVMQLETAACGRLNSLYKGIFQEILHRCVPLGIDYIGLRIIDTESIPFDGCPFILEAVFSPQACFQDHAHSLPEVAELVKSCMFEILSEVNVAYSAIQSMLDEQDKRDELHPINVLHENEDFEGLEDFITVKSKNIADYVEKSLRNKPLIMGSTFIVNDFSLSTEPPEKLFQVMADDPVPEREINEENDVYVRSAFGEVNGEYYMKIDGVNVGRTARAVEVQLDQHKVFTNEMRNAAGRVNVRHLYQLSEKVVDLLYVRCKRRVTRPGLDSRHEIVHRIGNVRKIHEIRQSQLNGPVSSLDTIVAERRGLL